MSRAMMHHEKGEAAVLHVALWEPEIPPNTGNVARLCAATGAALHLIGRLGFRLGDPSLRRARPDYWGEVTLHRHATWEEFDAFRAGARLFCFSARARQLYTRVAYQAGDYLLFGSESHGLPPGFLVRFAEQAVQIPQPTGRVRSLN